MMKMLQLSRACACAAALAVATPAYTALGRSGAAEIVVEASSG